MEPALKVACDRGHGKRQHVIVAATPPLTLRERKFAELMDRFKADHTIFPQPCPGLVDIVEHGQLDDHDMVMRTLHQYFDNYDLSDHRLRGARLHAFRVLPRLFPRTAADTAAIIDGNEGTVRHWLWCWNRWASSLRRRRRAASRSPIPTRPHASPRCTCCTARSRPRPPPAFCEREHVPKGDRNGKLGMQHGHRHRLAHGTHKTLNAKTGKGRIWPTGQR